MKFNKEILKTMTQEEIKDLRDAILKADGFNDIDRYDQTVIRPEIIPTTSLLPEQVNQAVLKNYPFRTNTDRFVFEQYAMGLSSREIETLLLKKRKLKKYDHATICRKINKILAVYGRTK